MAYTVYNMYMKYYLSECMRSWRRWGRSPAHTTCFRLPKHFFKALDHDGDGKLGFWDVMTIYYIIESGRPFCGCCGDFIPDMYFSCVICFEDPDDPFDACHNCYQLNKWKHSHGGRRALLLDNYTLLRTKRLAPPCARVDPPISTSTAIVVASPQVSNIYKYSLRLIGSLMFIIIYTPFVHGS